MTKLANPTLKEKSAPPAAAPPVRRYFRLFPRTLSRCMEETARPLCAKNGFHEMRILTQWPLIVGSNLAARCTPVKLTTGQNNKEGTLTIRAMGAAATEIHYAQPQILERLATYLGHHAITRLSIIQAPLLTEKNPEPVKEPVLDESSSSQLQDLLDNTTDMEMREALVKLGTRILTEKPPAKIKSHEQTLT